MRSAPSSVRLFLSGLFGVWLGCCPGKICPGEIYHPGVGWAEVGRGDAWDGAEPTVEVLIQVRERFCDSMNTHTHTHTHTHTAFNQ
eukprot:COSAG01_NODE_18328_length_1084_cov_1.768528_1_plen_85_part_10